MYYGTEGFKGVDPHHAEKTRENFSRDAVSLLLPSLPCARKLFDAIYQWLNAWCLASFLSCLPDIIKYHQVYREALGPWKDVSFNCVPPLKPLGTTFAVRFEWLGKPMNHDVDISFLLKVSIFINTFGCNVIPIAGAPYIPRWNIFCNIQLHLWYKRNVMRYDVIVISFCFTRFS